MRTTNLLVASCLYVGVGICLLGTLSCQPPNFHAASGAAGNIGGMDAAGGGPPDSAKPGLRISYWHGTAVIAGQGFNWTPDDQGNWVDPNTGQHYKADEKSGTAGAGIDEYNVVYVDANKSVVGHTTLSLLQGSAYTVTHMAVLGPANSPGAIFLNPAALRSAPSDSSPDHGVIHGSWPVGGKNTDAVITKGVTAAGHTVFVYDANTGMMLHYGATSVAGGQAVTGGENNTPSTSINNIEILGTRQITVPWANDPDPACAANFHSLDLQGQISSNGFNQTYEIKYTLKDKGQGWVACDVASITGSLVRAGIPTTLNSSMATGSNQLDPLWINPSTLAKLQTGQTIDTDPYSKIVTAVGDRKEWPKGQMLIIHHTSPIQVLSCGYDLATGMLVYVRNSDGAFGRDIQVYLASTD